MSCEWPVHSSQPYCQVWFLPGPLVSPFAMIPTPSTCSPLHLSLIPPSAHPGIIFTVSWTQTSLSLCILLPDLPETPLVYHHQPARVVSWEDDQADAQNPRFLSPLSLTLWPVCMLSFHDFSFPVSGNTGWWSSLHHLSCQESLGLLFLCRIASPPLTILALRFSASCCAFFFLSSLNMPTHPPKKPVCPFSQCFLACRAFPISHLYIQTPALPLGLFRVPLCLREPSWLDSANIWSLGLLLPRRHRFWVIVSITLYYIIPGAGPICWMEKHLPVDWHQEQGSLSLLWIPLSAGFLFPIQTWEQLVSAHPQMSPAAPASFLGGERGFPDPSCGAQGRVSDRVAKDRWSELRYTDIQHLRVKKDGKTERTSHQCGKWRKVVWQLIFPSCFHLKKEAAQKCSPPQPAKPDGP